MIIINDTMYCTKILLKEIIEFLLSMCFLMEQSYQMGFIVWWVHHENQRSFDFFLYIYPNLITNS